MPPAPSPGRRGQCVPGPSWTRADPGRSQGKKGVTPLPRGVAVGMGESLDARGQMHVVDSSQRAASLLQSRVRAQIEERGRVGSYRGKGGAWKDGAWRLIGVIMTGIEVAPNLSPHRPGAGARHPGPRETVGGTAGGKAGGTAGRVVGRQWGQSLPATPSPGQRTPSRQPHDGKGLTQVLTGYGSA